MASDLERQAAQLKRIQSQFSVGRFNGFLDERGIKQTAFAYARAAQDLRDLTVGNLRTFQREVVQKSREAFEASILWPQVSVTKGGERYGTDRGRQTGRFTFGSSGTFKNVTSFDEKKGRYIVGWPDVERADQRTRGIWRRLEFGLPASLHFLPRGGGFLTETGQFVPGRGPATRKGQGFDEKLFLQRGFDAASASRLPKFNEVLQEAIRGLNSSTPSLRGRTQQII